LIRLSIITVALNNADTIEETIASVLSQSYRQLEYIIIDGGSTDGTLEIIERHRNDIKQILSESDRGMYDAMNKGISLARGDFVGILNADDTYYDRNVLQQVAEHLELSGADACYGDLAYVNRTSSADIIRFWRAGDYHRSKLYMGWMPPHPTFFVRKDYYDSFGAYRIDLGTSADYELMLRYLLLHSLTPAYINQKLVKMRVGGLSNKTAVYRLKAHMMDWRAWRVNGLWPYPWTIPLKPLLKIPQWFRRG
jgi:glycosyltransferase